MAGVELVATVGITDASCFKAFISGLRCFGDVARFFFTSTGLLIMDTAGEGGNVLTSAFFPRERLREYSFNTKYSPPYEEDGYWVRAANLKELETYLKSVKKSNWIVLSVYSNNKYQISIGTGNEPMPSYQNGLFTECEDRDICEGDISVPENAPTGTIVAHDFKVMNDSLKAMPRQTHVVYRLSKNGRGVQVRTPSGNGLSRDIGYYLSSNADEGHMARIEAMMRGAVITPPPSQLTSVIVDEEDTNPHVRVPQTLVKAWAKTDAIVGNKNLLLNVYMAQEEDYVMLKVVEPVGQSGCWKVLVRTQHRQHTQQ
jgi:hypothetical protein